MINATQQGSGKKTGRIVLQALFILLVVLIGLFHLKSSILSEVGLTRRIYLDKLSPFLTNPDTLAMLAKREHLGTGDLNKAQLLYHRALDSFVLHAPSWLGLAEVFYDLGRKDQAVAALKTLDTLKLNNTDLMWSKAKLAHALNEGQILLSTLVQLADEDTTPTQRIKIFNLVEQTWDDPVFLMKNFKAQLYPDILSMYIRNNQPDNAKKVWTKIQEKGIEIPEVTFPYVDLLLEHNAFDLAANVWQYSFRQDGPLLFNGDFDQPVSHAGFGWHASESGSVSLEPAGSGEGLTIFFNGTENVAFRFAQTVPLYPGKHVFSGTFETDDLTSEQLPFWKITGYNCAGLFIEDLMVPPSEHLTEFKIPFTVPEGCKAIELALLRNKANRFDSLISGSITVNKLDITRISPLPVLPSKPEKPKVEQEVEPTPEPTSEPPPDLVEEHVDETVPEPAKEPVVEPVAEVEPEPVAESAVEPPTEPEPLPVAQRKTTIHINKMVIKP